MLELNIVNHLEPPRSQLTTHQHDIPTIIPVETSQAGAVDICQLPFQVSLNQHKQELQIGGSAARVGRHQKQDCKLFKSIIHIIANLGRHEFCLPI